MRNNEQRYGIGDFHFCCLQNIINAFIGVLLQLESYGSFLKIYLNIFKNILIYFVSFLNTTTIEFSRLNFQFCDSQLVNPTDNNCVLS